MSIDIKIVKQDDVEYKALYSGKVHIPGSSLLPMTMSNEQCIQTWINDDIDTFIKADLILASNIIENVPAHTPSALWLALYLQTSSSVWRERLSNVELADNIFPENWNITTPAALEEFTCKIDKTYLYSYIAALNPNSITIQKHKLNKTPISKASITHTKTKTIDVLSWSTSFIKMFDDEIRGYRDTYQIQKNEDGFKLRHSANEENVEEHIDRELLPYRHKIDNSPETINALIQKLEKLHISTTILLAKELDAAINNNPFSKLIIEQTLNLPWDSLSLQVHLLKETTKDNIEIIEELKLSTSKQLSEEQTAQIDMPVF